MAWTTPKNWEDNELVTAEKLNTHPRDNLKFLYPPSVVRVYNNASISINNATWTALTFNAERFDADDLHESVTNPGRLTCKIAGKYLIFGHVVFDSNGTGYRAIA